MVLVSTGLLWHLQYKNEGEVLLEGGEDCSHTPRVIVSIAHYGQAWGTGIVWIYVDKTELAELTETSPVAEGRGPRLSGSVLLTT